LDHQASNGSDVLKKQLMALCSNLLIMQVDNLHKMLEISRMQTHSLAELAATHEMMMS
jgi:hypothetical protein